MRCDPSSGPVYLENFRGLTANKRTQSRLLHRQEGPSQIQPVCFLMPHLTCLYLALCLCISFMALFALPCPRHSSRCMGSMLTLLTLVGSLSDVLVSYSHKTPASFSWTICCHLLAAVVTLSVGGEAFARPQKNGQITTPLSLGIYLFGKHLRCTCCLYWCWEEEEHTVSNPQGVPSLVGGNDSQAGSNQVFW